MLLQAPLGDIKIKNSKKIRCFFKIFVNIKVYLYIFTAIISIEYKYLINFIYRIVNCEFAIFNIIYVK